MRKAKCEMLADVTCTKSKVIDRNTVEYYTDNARVIRLHLTDIITFKKDGSVVLNSGGWKTPTTKDRINKYSGYNITQEKSIWWLHHKGETYMFKDGITINYNKVTNYDSNPEKFLKLKKNINTYIDNFVTKLLDKKIDEPGGGDCWYCLMKNDNGVSLGDVSKDNSHLINHIKDKYYVPSLLVNALLEYTANALLEYKAGVLIMDYVYRLMNKIDIHEYMNSVIERNCKSALRSYFYNRLGVAK